MFRKHIQGTIICCLLLLSCYGAAYSQTANIDDINRRIEELNKLPDKPLTDNIVIIYNEYDDLGAEIDRYQKNANYIQMNDEIIKNLNDIKDKTDKLIINMGKLNENSTRDELDKRAGEYLKISQETSKISGDTVFNFDTGVLQGINPLQSLDNDTIKKATDKELFSLINKYFGDGEIQNQFLEYIDSNIKRFETEDSDSQKLKGAINILISLLQNRRAMLQKYMNDMTVQQTIGKQLWIVISIIGVLSIAAMGLVRIYPGPLQTEWVASGQVTQFVTVMILLSVILALGLTKILEANTLGTLLGGIAGYVLAQGVGRAAAREVSRSHEAASRMGNFPQNTQTGQGSGESQEDESQG